MLPCLPLLLFLSISLPCLQQPDDCILNLAGSTFGFIVLCGFSSSSDGDELIQVFRDDVIHAGKDRMLLAGHRVDDCAKVLK